MRGLDLLGDFGDGSWDVLKEIHLEAGSNQGITLLECLKIHPGEPGYLETEGHI